MTDQSKHDQMLALVERLTELRNAASKGDLNTAEFKEKGWFECQFCDGSGEVEGEQFINYDGVAVNVLFTGIGQEFGASQKFYTEVCREWGNVAAALTAALDEIATLRTEKHADAEAIGALRGALSAMLDLQDSASPFGGEMYQDRVDRVFDQCREALKGSDQ